jgi:hypothetical protein
MAFLTSKMKVEQDYEALGKKFINCLKFKLSQDGAAYEQRHLEAFGKWLSAKTRRVARYEKADMLLVEEFIDFFWPWIMDPQKPLPVDAPEPPVVRPARAPGPHIDWHAVARAAGVAPAVANQVIAQEQAGLHPADIANARNPRLAFNEANQQWVILEN